MVFDREEASAHPHEHGENMLISHRKAHAPAGTPDP